MKVGWSILPIVGDLPVLATDPPAIVKMLSTTEYNIQTIIDKMTLADLKIMNGLVLKHKANIAKDTSIKAYAEVLGDFQNVQD